MGAREYDPRTARWLQRDPIDAASGDPNLYRYAGNDPINGIDPSGLDWLDVTANFFAGVGDSLTFGLTDRVREWLGSNEVIDKTSLAYRVGEYTEVGAEIVLTGGSKALIHLARKKGRDLIRQESLRFIRQLRLPGKFVHHVNPLSGHPGGEGTLFPLGGLPPSIHSGRWNLEVLDRTTHLQRHRRMRQQEKLLRYNTNRYTITLRTMNNLRRDIENECSE
ncbi:MAG: hypothetical protein KatS3mg016_1360 [Fimbriimonadales bacterium]|nr:MAG: hypothetical protein KatS3mg016_1360 [Fimbriimonadales bacterium]